MQGCVCVSVCAPVPGMKAWVFGLGCGGKRGPGARCMPPTSAGKGQGHRVEAALTEAS